MVSKKTTDRANSNFRQQDSTARKLESNFDTAAQKQFAQTATVIDGAGNQEQKQEKLQKQYTNQTDHSSNEFRQQESTISKIDNVVQTEQQQQFLQSANKIEVVESDNQGKLRNQFSQDYQKQENSLNVSTHNSKLEKKFSDQAREEFRQQESTASKINNVLQTEQQQQFSQSANKIEVVESDNQGKLRNQFSQDYQKQENSLNVSTHNSKLQKKFSDQAREEFRQQESKISKIDNVLQTEQQQQFSHSTNKIEVVERNNQGKLRNQFSQDYQTQENNLKAPSHNSKLQKKFSDQEREKLKQQESKISKIDNVLQTEQQQQFSHSANKIEIVESDNQGKLRKQFSTQENSSKFSVQKAKLQKKFSDQAREEFRQQESTANKIDKGANAPAKNTDGEKEKLQKPKSSVKQKKFKLHKELAKGSLATASNTFKKGIQKYQSELEKDDEAVKFTSQSATYTAKLSATAVRKLKEKRLKKVNFKKAKENPLYKEKPKKETSLKKISKAPASMLTHGMKKYQDELEKGDEAVKLTSQGATQIARATKKLTKGVAKINAKSGKLGKQNTKLKQIRLNKSKKLKTKSKAVLKKKAIKKKLYYAPTRKKKAIAGAMSSFSNRMSNIFKNIAKFNRMIVTKMLGAKAAAFLGSGIAAVLPIIIVAALVLVIVGVMGGSSEQNQPIVGSKNLSPEVEQWRPLVETEAAAQGMENYIGLILAIIQVETGGTGTRDIMQSSESAGFPRNYWSTEEQSVRQGIKHLKNIVNMVKPFGLENNYKLLAQAYNFGSAFASFVVNLGGDYNLDVAERYSRDVVAPSLGNHTGERYSYVNETSKRLGKTYLYRNGGNFMYGELVAEYLGGVGGSITGDFAIVVAELEKYLGWEYVWGGKSPSTGFDCSGFVSWGLKQIGIDLPSYAASQYDLTVPIDPSQAQPGDLIFFKGTYGGPNHVSHVGFYIDENTMLDSNGSGIGYHNWKDSYWQKHYAGIRRIAGN